MITIFRRWERQCRGVEKSQQMSKTAISRNSKLFRNMKEETAKRQKMVASNVQTLGQGTVVFQILF